MQGESNPPAFPRDVLLLSCMFFLFVVSIVSPLYVATTTPAETSDAVGDGQFTTTWKVNTVIERSEWSNATPILGIENSTLSSSNEFQATSSIFEPSGEK